VLFSGEMGWSSGCDHAEWAIVGFRRATRRAARTTAFVLPRSDYQIRDDWFAAGMRASGSRTLVVDRAFMPEHRIQRAKDMMEGTSAGFGLYPDSAIFFNPYRPISPVASPPSAWASPSACSKPSRTRPQPRAGLHRRRGRRGDPGADAPGRVHHQVAAARALLEKTGSRSPTSAHATNTRPVPSWPTGAPTRAMR
jgi:hypothetical protein